MVDELTAVMAAPASEPAVNATSSTPPASQPNTVVVTSIDPVIQLPQLEEIFSAIGQLTSIRWFDAPNNSGKVCLLEYADEGQASSALIISDMHIMLGSKEIGVRKWDSWWQQQQEEAAKREQQQLAATAAAAITAATATVTQSASPMSATQPSVVSLSDPASIASAALAAAQLAQSLSASPTSLYPAAVIYDPNLTTIYVGNLAPPVTEELLTAYFSQVGPLTAVRLQADGTSPNRFAFVEFVEVEKANAALALHGQLLLNRPMKVGKASTPITNRALLGVTTAGGGGLSEAERVARLQLAGNVSGDRVAAALARVAQAQQLIANKLGVAVQAPISATIPALAAVLPASTAAVVTAPTSAVSKVSSGERKRSTSRSRSSERNRRRRRSFSHSRSRSPSISRSHSPSHSRSRSRSPIHKQRRVRRWSRDRDRDRDRGRRGDRRRSREVSEERRERRHGRRRSYSRSPSPRPERRVSAEHEKKEEEMDVSSDRWRGRTDTEHSADGDDKKQKQPTEERKDATHKEEDRGREAGRERESERDRDRYRDEKRRDRGRDGDRERDRSRSRDRYRGRDSRPSRHSRHRHSSESDDGEFVHRRARDNAGQRNRYKKNAGREGMQWDGYQWVSTAVALNNISSTLAVPVVNSPLTIRVVCCALDTEIATEQ